MNDVYRIHPEDSVAVALHPLAPGDTAQGNGFSVSVREAIPAGHKIALYRMESGKSVLDVYKRQAPPRLSIRRRTA